MNLKLNFLCFDFDYLSVTLVAVTEKKGVDICTYIDDRKILHWITPSNC